MTELKLGDCLEVMREMPENSVDSIVTDPPAGISFMGKEWDHHKGGRIEWITWLTSVMHECLRVMKPGAHGFVWAIPRTSHWTATALENAGFEIRDVVTHLFGTGFPKSLDISKAIDKAAGVEREVVGSRPLTGGGRTMKGGNFSSTGDKTVKQETYEFTAPATPEAKQWSGWGTALKPASEHWILVRKPISEKTVAANVLKWGTGGINIDGCRIPGVKASATDTDFRKSRKDTKGFGYVGNVVKSANQVDVTEGRFPANLILDEQAAAMLDEQSGNKCGAAAPVRKKATPGSTNVDNYKPHTSVGDDGKSFRGDTGGASRFFFVARSDNQGGWEQSKTSTQKSANIAASTSAQLNALVGSVQKLAVTLEALEDASSVGTALRFTHETLSGLSVSGEIDIIQIQNTAQKCLHELLLTSMSHSDLATAAAIQKLTDIITTTASLLRCAFSAGDATSNSTPMNWALGAKGFASRFIYVAKASASEKNAGVEKNTHPTVKPIKLMRYLCRLITPPGGIVLDPFMGSGSTGIAAKQESFGFIGIEREPEYMEIAEKRIGA